MKLSRRFKIIFFATIVSLYLTGVITWLLQNWFFVDAGFGASPRPQAASLLHWHSVVGLWFIALFGYFYHYHVMVGLHRKKKTRSGLPLLAFVIAIVATVPGLFYLTDEGSKHAVSLFHIFGGMTLLLPFVFHSRKDKSRRH